MGYSDNGDYLEFLVNVRDAGWYNVDIRYSTPDNNTRAELALLNSGVKNVLATADFTVTGGWQNWSTKTVSVNLPAGVHRLRFTVVTGRFNTNYLNFRGSATSTGNMKVSRALTVYPNPSAGVFNLNVDHELQENFQLKVTDVCGKVCFQKKMESLQHLTIDLSGKSKGIYFLNVSSGELNFTKALVVQ